MNSKIWVICTVACAVCMAIAALLAAVNGECGGALECQGSVVPMKCHWAYLVAVSVSAAGSLVALVGLMMKTREGKLGITLGVCVCAALCFLVLFVIVGVCANIQMTCNTNRIPVVMLLLAGVILTVVGMLTSSAKKVAKPKARL